MRRACVSTERSVHPVSDQPVSDPSGSDRLVSYGGDPDRSPRTNRGLGGRAAVGVESGPPKSRAVEGHSRPEADALAAVGIRSDEESGREDPRLKWPQGSSGTTHAPSEDLQVTARFPSVGERLQLSAGERPGVTPHLLPVFEENKRGKPLHVMLFGEVAVGHRVHRRHDALLAA